MFVILASCVIAAQPSFLEVQESTDGLNIIYPKNTYFLSNNAIDLHFHVYNSTNREQTNLTTYCNIHLYNTTGNHILKQNLSYSGNEFEIKLLPSQISNLDAIYPYLVFCENMDQAGFISHSFEVNKSGKPPTDQLSFILGVALVSIILLLFAFKLDNEHFILRLLIILVSITNLILIPRSLIFLGNTNVTFYRLYLYFFTAFWLYVGGYLVYAIFKYFGVILPKQSKK